MMDDFGQRIPGAADIEALAKMVEASRQSMILTADDRKKIGDVLHTYCKQFKSLDNDG